MGLRLLILSLWTPKFIIRRKLNSISELTTTALDSLVSKYAKSKVEFSNLEKQSIASIQQQRAVMAQTQARLIEKLKTAIGQQEAVKQGREILFLVGQILGRQIRAELRVSDTSEDLTRAAKILYRVLGIEFHLEWVDDSKARAIIDRCSLAEQYSKLTCEVLSAVDEGVINGLQPNVKMQFKEYMTSGCANCMADIDFQEKVNVK